MQIENSIDSCFVLPVIHHEIGNLKDFWDDASEKFGTDIEGHFKLSGIQSMQIFLQTMQDDRNYLVIYLRSRDRFDVTLHRLFGEDLPCSKYLARRFEGFTGLDMSKPENLPKIDMLMDWQETHEYLEERNMLLLPWCSAAPLKPGMAGEVRKYVGEALARSDEMEKLLRDHDIVKSLAFIQHMPQADYVVKYMVASNSPTDMIKSLLACGNEMCTRALHFSKDITGIDFSDPKNQPEIKLLFKWDESRGFDTAEQMIAYTQ